MANDDMEKIIYIILTELYACMKQGCKVNKADIGYERLGIPYSYWVSILIEMQEKGYIKGVMCRQTKGTGRAVGIDDIEITFEGVTFLKENSLMQKVKEALKDIRDIVPEM